MARARIRSGGLIMDVELEGLEATERAFRDVRTQVARGADAEAVQAAKLTIMPAAKRRAGNLKVAGASIAESLYIRRIRGGARLTTRLRGIRGRAVGLLEFGGTVHAPIRARKRKAIFIPGSAHPVSVVRTAREYRARRFMVGAKEEKLGAFERELRDRIVGFFERQGFEVG